MVYPFCRVLLNLLLFAEKLRVPFEETTASVLVTKTSEADLPSDSLRLQHCNISQSKKGGKKEKKKKKKKGNDIKSFGRNVN